MRIFEKIFSPTVILHLFLFGDIHSVSVFCFFVFWFFFFYMNVIEIIPKHEYLINIIIDKPSKII